MSPFEEQVAIAIADAFQDAIRAGVGDSHYGPGYYFVARRVAAAIDEASRNTLSVETARAAGLAALRGAAFRATQEPK